MPPSPGRKRRTDNQLLKAAQAGDKEAFAGFCVRALPGLCRYLHHQCEAVGVPVDLAEDFAHETVMNALRSPPGSEVCVSWLRRIGHNLVIDWVRKNRRIQAVENMEEQVEARAPSIEEREEYEEVLEFLEWMDTNDREILELVLLKGLPPVEAGAELGLDKWAAYKAYERAHQALRDLIQEHGKVARE